MLAMVNQKLIVKCIELFMPTLILQLPLLMLRLFKLDFFKILKSFSTSGNYLRLMLKILFKIILKPPTFMLTI